MEKPTKKQQEWRAMRGNCHKSNCGKSLERAGSISFNENSTLKTCPFLWLFLHEKGFRDLISRKEVNRGFVVIFDDIRHSM